MSEHNMHEFLQHYSFNAVTVADRNKYFENRSWFNPNVFVISRKKDHDRFTHTQTLLTNLNLHPMHFMAMEGKDQIKPSSYKHLTASEYGCLLSHFGVVWYAAQHHDPEQYTIAFEDDIISTLSGIGFLHQMNNLRTVLSTRERRPDMIYLGKCMESCHCMKQIHETLYDGASPSCLHAYMIQNATARKMIAQGGLMHPDFMDQPIDIAYKRLIMNKTFQVLVYHPSLFFQEVLQTESALRSREEQLNNYLECYESGIYFHKMGLHTASRFVFCLIVVAFCIYLLKIFITQTASES